MEQPQPETGILPFLKKHGLRILALLFSAGIMVAVWIFRGELTHLGSYGYLGVFLIGLVGNATVILPVPGLAVTFAGASVLSWPLVGLAAGLGEPLGELTGYLAGYSGRGVIENRDRFERVEHWLMANGFVTILILSAIPNPLFDLAGIAAGILRYPVGKFLLACWLGKTFKALVVAYLGSLSAGLLEGWMLG